MSQVAPVEVRPRHHNAWMTFLISFSAAVCMAGGFAIMGVAFVFASAVLFDLSSTLVWTANGIIGIATLWGFVWVFSRSWHVEKRLGSGIEIDDPKASIIENWRD
jgi:hypothetical protein